MRRRIGKVLILTVIFVLTISFLEKNGAGLLAKIHEMTAKKEVAAASATAAPATAAPKNAAPKPIEGLPEVVIVGIDGTTSAPSVTETPRTERQGEEERDNQTEQTPYENESQTPEATVEPADSPDEITRESKEETPEEIPSEVPREIPTEIPDEAPETPPDNKGYKASRDPYFSAGEYGSAYYAGELSNEKHSWNYTPNKDQLPPIATNAFDYRKFDALYLGDIYSNDIYLTFDEGYEMGFSDKILDTLREKGVKAAFFVTEPYIAKNAGLIKRMVNEGHLVCNHSVNHLSSPDLSDDEFLREISGVESAFKRVTGLNMPKFFRPPSGEYSARTLELAKEAGYITVFWSFAYRDWLTDAQPPRDKAYEYVTASMHGGAIPLMHAVSETNAAILGDVIDFLLEKGYTFKRLDYIVD